MSTTSNNNNQENIEPICTIDPYQYMQIKLNPNGSITRLLQIPHTSPTPDPTSSSLVLSKDFPLNSTHNTSLRIFIPKVVLSTNTKLPVIVYSHGGGFVILHVDSCFNHEFCETLALKMNAIVVSVDYRLAPEHRLPSAYEDVLETLRWIRDVELSKKCEWLSKFGDVSNTFLMGTSAGGNIAYHAGLRALDVEKDLNPLRLTGLILHQPFFGGSKRTGSEIRLVNDPSLPLSGNDLYWELGLPIGSDRDHEFCNPMVGVESGKLERLKGSGCRVLVTDCSGDPLVDRVKVFAAMLREKGVNVKGYFTEGDYHGMELLDSDLSKRESFMVTIQEFVNSCMDVN